MRRSTGSWLTIAAITILVVACDGTTISPPSSAGTEPPGTSTPDSTLPPIVECPGIGEFNEGGAIAVVEGTESDSTTLGEITWTANDQCETFAFEFQTAEGAPATSVPEIRIDHLESFQVIRIRLDVTRAVLTDQLVETALVDRLYVVDALDGDLFVDLHLASPAAVRARWTSSPARLTLDLRPGLTEFFGTSTVGETTVVVSPASGTAVPVTAQFMGYSRVEDGEVVLVVTQDGAIASQTSTSTVSTDATWREFQQTIGLPPGEVSVLVGESDPEDGSLDGVTVEVTAG